MGVLPFWRGGLPVVSPQLQLLAHPGMWVTPGFQLEVRQQLRQLTKVVPNLPSERLRLPGVGFLSAVAESVGLS